MVHNETRTEGETLIYTPSHYPAHTSCCRSATASGFTSERNSWCSNHLPQRAGQVYELTDVTTAILKPCDILQVREVENAKKRDNRKKVRKTERTNEGRKKKCKKQMEKRRNEKFMQQSKKRTSGKNKDLKRERHRTEEKKQRKEGKKQKIN